MGADMSIDIFEANLVKKLGKDNFLKVQNAKIGIAGAGGLGSNCALNLARAGFMRFTIADFDLIEPSNLDRQFYFLDQVGKVKVEALKENLLKVNPRLEIEDMKVRIEKGNVDSIFDKCDIVAECLDNAANKRMLVEELLKAGKFVVAVSGLGGIGSSDEIQIYSIKKNFVMIGDLESDICHRPALSPRVNIAAAKQADVILEYVINKD